MARRVGSDGARTATNPHTAAYWTHFGARTFAFAWVGVEGTRQALQMRRRLALGLVDPVVANRFWLFAGFGWCAALMSCIGAVGAVAVPVASWTSDAVALTTSALGLAAAVWMWLAFFPPAAYRSWVAARA